jgi:choline dehydrogenase-like flavoprotein
MKVYDAIVVGSGACGGWAAMELSSAGMKVLMLEAGSKIVPAQDFHHRFLYEMEFRGQGKPGSMRRYTGTERNYRIMLDSSENPYTTSADTNYRWTRSRCLGGRTMHWARATDRMADYEFKAASRDGYGMDWAVNYADMKPYYDRVERIIGVSGAMEGMPQFPDGVFLPPMALNLRGDDFYGVVEEPGLGVDAPAAGAVDAHAQQSSAVPLLRQLREPVRRGRDVQHGRRDAAAGVENRESGCADRLRGGYGADGQRESREGRHVY